MRRIDGNKSDLTSGGILQKLVFVALPIMGTQLMQMTYNLTDMFWLGRLSSDAVAASGIAGMFMWLGMALFLVGRMGSEIGVSQNKGRGDLDEAKAFAQNALLTAFVLGVLYGAFMLIITPKHLIFLFNIEEAHVAEMAAAYTGITGLAMPMFYMSASLTGAFNGSGNSRVPFLSHATGITVNIILSPIMIFPLGLGIQGAAAATVIAQSIVLTMLILFVKKHRDRPFSKFSLLVKPSFVKIKQILRWSIPISLESMLFTLLTMAVTRRVAGCGAGALAVSRVGVQVESLSWLIAGGFGTALTAFMGQNFGAGKRERMRKGFGIATAVMSVWGVVVTFALFFFGYFFFSLFLAEHELREMGAVYLKILAVCQIVGCLEAVGAGFYRGSGKTLPPSVMSISTNIIRVPLCYVLASTSLGLNGVWWGIAISAFLRGALIYGGAAVILLRGKRND
jgi:putative MATE family efflux protein